MRAPVRADASGALAGTRVSIVRHAHAQSNADGVIRGERTCTGLTELGREQAGHLARRVEYDHADDPITAVYSAPLPRAIETAEPVAAALGLDVQYLPHWRYADYGTADGRTWHQVYRDYPGPHPALHPDRPIAEGAQTAVAFRAQTLAAIEELEHRHPGQHVLLVGSTENLMAVHEVLADLAPDSRARTNVVTDYTGVTTWDLTHVSWSPHRRAILLRHNDSSHLPAPQRDSRYRAVATPAPQA